MRRLKPVKFVWVPQEQSHNMEVIDEQKSQEDQSEGSPAAEKEGRSRLWVPDVIKKCLCFFTLCLCFASQQRRPAFPTTTTP